MIIRLYLCVILCVSPCHLWDGSRSGSGVRMGSIHEPCACGLNAAAGGCTPTLDQVRCVPRAGRASSANPAAHQGPDPARAGSTASIWGGTAQSSDRRLWQGSPCWDSYRFRIQSFHNAAAADWSPVFMHATSRPPGGICAAHFAANRLFGDQNMEPLSHAAMCLALWLRCVCVRCGQWDGLWTLLCHGKAFSCGTYGSKCGVFWIARWLSPSISLEPQWSLWNTGIGRASC